MSAAIYHRKSPRLAGFDYGSRRVYFVTVCTKDRKPLLSRIVGTHLDASSAHAEIHLTPIGKIAEQELLNIPAHFPDVEIIKYAVMPDHVHILLGLGCTDEAAEDASRCVPTLGTVVKLYKGGVRRRCGIALWQSRYNDHVIRDEKDFQAIWQYIENNPMQWLLDGKA